MSTLRSTNTSRAYWELKAEQVMDRVFHPDSDLAPELQETIEVDVREATPTPASSPSKTSLAERLRSRQWVVAAVLLCSLGASVGLWQGWSTTQRQLRLERNARLLSDLRNLSPSDEPAPSASLPPPVEEAWIAQLPPLPAVPATLEPATNSGSATAARTARIGRRGPNPRPTGVGHLSTGRQLQQRARRRTDRQQRLATGLHPERWGRD